MFEEERPGCFGCVGVLLFVLFIFGLGCINWEKSEDLVSGIVYDNINNEFISGNSSFKIRASADMYADENTSRTYCLPPKSPYIETVKKSAADKKKRVVVSTRKDFQILWPWQCMANVVVEEEK